MVVIGLVLGILAFYSFDLPWIMTQGGPGESSTILGISDVQGGVPGAPPRLCRGDQHGDAGDPVLGSLATLRLRRREP